MKVTFNNLTPDNGLLQELTQAYLRVMTSGQYIGGSEVEAFEQEWADYCKADYCVSCSSGQAALELLLRVYGVGFGDEVIVPSWTAVPTWKAVINVGAIPKPVDVNRDTFLLDPQNAMSKITNRTKAIIPVHLYGYRANTEYLSGDWAIIQDACQAHGLKDLDTAAWSFYPTKNLGAYGDGGAITTDNKTLALLLREGRNSSRLDPLQAAFLRVKLTGLDEMNRLRTKDVDRYWKGLLKSSARVNKIKKPLASTYIGEVSHLGVFHQYVIRSKERDLLKAHLASRGIETLIHYPLPPHRVLGFDYDLPVADRLSQEVLSLPITCSQKQIEYVCEVINEFYFS